MIETKHLIEFMRDTIDFSNEVPDIQDLYNEYIAEIVARLRAYDKLIESLEKLCHRLSNGVDE